MRSTKDIPADVAVWFDRVLDSWRLCVCRNTRSGYIEAGSGQGAERWRSLPRPV